MGSFTDSGFSSAGINTVSADESADTAAISGTDTGSADFDSLQSTRFFCSALTNNKNDISKRTADPAAVLAQFPDAAALSSWAVEPFAWAIDRGIILGTDGMLAGKETATRAQAAAVLYRYFFENRGGNGT